MLFKRWCRRNVDKPDAGFSLVEVLIGVILAGFVSVMVLNTFVRTTKSTDDTIKVNVTSANVSVAMSYVMNGLHTTTNPGLAGSALVSFGPVIRSSLSSTGFQRATNNNTQATLFTSLKNEGVVLMHLYVNNQHQLIRDYIPCEPSCGVSEHYAEPIIETKVLAENVVVPAANERPIFTWYQTGSKTTAVPSSAKGYLEDTESIAGVHVSLTLRPVAGGKSMSSESFQALPNKSVEGGSSVAWQELPFPGLPLPGTTPGSEGYSELGPNPEFVIAVSEDFKTWKYQSSGSGAVYDSGSGFVGLA